MSTNQVTNRGGSISRADAVGFGRPCLYQVSLAVPIYWNFESRKPGDELFTLHQCLRASPRAISGLRDYQRGCCPSACLKSVLPSSEQSFALGQPPADAPHRLCLCHGQVLPADQSVRRGPPINMRLTAAHVGCSHHTLEPRGRAQCMRSSMVSINGETPGIQHWAPEKCRLPDWKAPVHLGCRGQTTSESRRAQARYDRATTVEAAASKHSPVPRPRKHVTDAVLCMITFSSLKSPQPLTHGRMHEGIPRPSADAATLHPFAPAGTKQRSRAGWSGWSRQLNSSPEPNTTPYSSDDHDH